MYVISLPRSIERRLNITSAIREHSLQLNFVPAVDGSLAIPPEQVCALPLPASLWLLRHKLCAPMARITGLRRVGAVQLATLNHSNPPNANISQLKDYIVNLPSCCRDTWPTQLACAVSHLLARPASATCCVQPQHAGCCIAEQTCRIGH